MSDKQQLQKAIDELKKAEEQITDRVNKAVEKVDRTRQEQAASQSRQA